MTDDYILAHLATIESAVSDMEELACKTYDAARANAEKARGRAMQIQAMVKTIREATRCGESEDEHGD